MPTLDTSRGSMPSPRTPSHKKFSLFRRFSRRTSDEHISTTNHDAYNAVVRPPARLHKRNTESAPPLSPPLSPARSKNDSLLDLKRSPSPHLTKDKAYRKDRTITYTQRFEIPQVVRERLSRESSSSSKASTSSQRVQANAIATKPWPSTPHTQIKVAKWDVFLPPAQVHGLYLGYLPQEMSDKWFVYSEGPDTMGKLKVHFHRSWTGAKIAELFVVMDVKGEGAGKIVGIKWNAGDDVGAGRMSGEEAKYLVRTTVRWVLGIELEEGR
ncbi:hypothetical protein CC86DRAFT_373027 [Ophiobolus disseminans]|uniref:Uncharacterized protein n=1 Tax=Ophiobolus disseminans TaxID=1469910 RepID=A0A6A6ZQK5_9PLEO|nr:hypothetical protein CC86DRAFT_373027 [Ophiobolus disseminans]